MNENINQLLEKLANKLGTTTEYLWSVLLRQAHISATIQLIQTIVVFIAAIVLIKLHRKFLKDDSYGSGEIDLPMLIGGLLTLILLVVAICSIDNIINGYFNPEFWALDHVLESIKPK